MNTDNKQAQLHENLISTSQPQFDTSVDISMISGIDQSALYETSFIEHLNKDKAEPTPKAVHTHKIEKK